MNQRSFSNEDGYSLVESIVSIALLLTVLVPVSGFLGKVATQRFSKQKIEALALAQEYMTLALQNQIYRDNSLPVNQWLVTETYQHQDDLIIIEVSVSKITRNRPVVSLKTARLLPATIDFDP